MKDKLNRNRPLRLDDMRCEDWSPLTAKELQTVAPLKLAEGKSEVDRLLLARLLGERDRLQCVLESANWLIEELDNAGFTEPTRMSSPDDYDPLEKAMHCLRLAIVACRK